MKTSLSDCICCWKLNWSLQLSDSRIWPDNYTGRLLLQVIVNFQFWNLHPSHTQTAPAEQEATLTVEDCCGMSQGQRRPQQQHLNMRVKTEQGLSQPSSPAAHHQNGKASHHQTNGIEGIQTGKKHLGIAFCEQFSLPIVAIVWTL